jgi:hypothetical protein
MKKGAGASPLFPKTDPPKTGISVEVEFQPPREANLFRTTLPSKRANRVPAFDTLITINHSIDKIRFNSVTGTKSDAHPTNPLQNPTDNLGDKSILWERHPCYINVTRALPSVSATL